MIHILCFARPDLLRVCAVAKDMDIQAVVGSFNAPLSAAHAEIDLKAHDMPSILLCGSFQNRIVRNFKFKVCVESEILSIS